MDSPGIAEGMGTDYVNEPSARPTEEDIVAGKEWKMVVSDSDRFTLKDHYQPGPQDTYVCYFSYWVFSSIDLGDLLNSGPDMPQLTKHFVYSDAGKLFLNGVELTPTSSEPLDSRIRQVYRSIPLQQGWNPFLVKVVTDTFDKPEQGTCSVVQMESDDESFGARLRTAVERKM